MIRRTIARALPVLVAATCAAGASGASTVAFVKLEGTLADREEVTPLLLGADQGALKTVPDVIGALKLASDPSSEIDGVVLRLVDFAPTRTQVEEIGAAMDEVRSRGRMIHVFSEQYGPAQLLLAAHADSVILQSGGAVSFPGLYMEELFLADALRSIGIEPSYVQVGAYKGAKEMFDNSQPSPEWNENISQLLDAMYETTVSQIGSGRGITAAQVEHAMEECFFADGATAIRDGLIDVEMDLPDLEGYLEDAYGDDFAWDEDLRPGGDSGMPDFASMSFFEAFSTMMEMFAGPGPGRLEGDTIAVVHINGVIADGDSSSGGLLGGGTTGSRTIRKVLREVEDEDHIKGVVVRIDSPGGSATASESIWLGLRRVAEKKPVWVSIGSMAASGGYYIAVGGDRVFVNPSSIVGSIGVVAGKFSLGELMGRMHVNVVQRHRGPNGGLFGMNQAWDDSQKQLVRQRMQDTYDLFVSRVRAGRKDIDISTAGEGRLFVGEDAIERRMADEIGGMEVAIDELASSLNLAPGSYDVVDYPAPKTFEEMLGDMFGAVRSPSLRTPVRAEIAAALRELVGEASWASVRDSLEAMLMLRKQHVLLISPRVLVIR